MIVLEELSFGYQRSEPIFSGVDFHFAKGQVSAVTGSSGRGKSTLLYLIGLLLTPWSGRVAIGEWPDASHLRDTDRSQLRAGRIGFVFQDAMLDPSRTVIDNVMEGALYAALPKATVRAEAEWLLDRFGVRLRADHRPGEVSGGQAQRVALCRAFVKRPDIILADEPTGNLDAETAQVVIDALTTAAHNEGATVIIASHDARIVAACDEAFDL